MERNWTGGSFIEQRPSTFSPFLDLMVPLSFKLASLGRRHKDNLECVEETF
jgi:hypothetical protein